MPRDTGGVQWDGRIAVVGLPQQIDSSNASQVREQLLWAINRGAVVLIADMTTTLSCDYSGADAVVRAYRRAVASGTELRLAVTADVVRSTLSLSGLDPLVPIYPTLRAAFAGPNGHDTLAERLVPTVADPPDSTAELLDSVVENIFTVALSLQEATDLPHGVIVQRISEAVGSLDDVVRRIRDHMFAQQTQGYQPGMIMGQPPDMYERLAQATVGSAVLRRRLGQTARAVHATATETAALLTQRANLAGEPQRIDYPTEIKRWRVIADQAQQIAERLDGSPPDS